jgi:hypothetical protein
MGATVLNPSEPPADGPLVYAHCLNDVPGGVALLILNTDRVVTKMLNVASASQRYTLTAPDLEGTHVDLNGKELKLGSGDSLPQLNGVATRPGPLTLAAASITFLAFRDARNASCR